MNGVIKMKKRKNKFLEHVISQEQMLVGLTNVDNNRWARLKDMIDLCGFYNVKIIVIFFFLKKKKRIFPTLSYQDMIDMGTHYNRLR